jgi:hypothetical protein
MEDVLKPTQAKSKEYKPDMIKALLQIALSTSASPSDSSPGSSKENHSRHMNEEPDLAEKEARQLRAVKKLIEVKGYESMIRFLES